MVNAIHEVQRAIAELGTELAEFATSQNIRFEGSTSVHKRLMLATWINIYGTEAYRLEDKRLSHRYPHVVYYETGFNVGHSAIVACETVAQLPEGGKVVSFELDEKKRPVAEKLQAMYPDILTVVWGDSNATVLKYFESTQEAPHIFFADGAHSLDKTEKELRVGWNVLREGGLLILDDSLDPVARRARNAFRSAECWIEANHQTGLSFLQKGQPWD